MEPPTYLRLEGLAVFAGALAVYFTLGGPWWLLVVLALAPDLAMVGYLAGPKVGALSYNTAHTYVLPAALGGAGVYADVPLAILLASIWAGHIGADRAVGYGLKYSSGFEDTHLTTQPAPLDALTQE